MSFSQKERKKNPEILWKDLVEEWMPVVFPPSLPITNFSELPNLIFWGGGGGLEKIQNVLHPTFSFTKKKIVWKIEQLRGGSYNLSNFCKMRKGLTSPTSLKSLTPWSWTEICDIKKGKLDFSRSSTPLLPTLPLVRVLVVPEPIFCLCCPLPMVLLLTHAQPVTVVCKMEAQLEYVYTLHTCYCMFGGDLYANSVLINKNFASELGRKFIKSASLVGQGQIS